MIPQEEETGNSIYKLIFTSIALYLLSGLSYATEDVNELQDSQVKAALTCLICRILNLMYLFCGAIILPPFAVFIIIAIILIILYHASPKENKRKQHYMVGLIFSVIILTLLLLLSTLLSLLPQLLSLIVDINLPNILEILEGCESVCELRPRIVG
ncbi:MAG: hypothetical protein U9Q22_00220 [Candidatus Altiarchaeota archaeon]|nr:hypothetical protein [Candidatus Altiarchaeota archaeon]